MIKKTLWYSPEKNELVIIGKIHNEMPELKMGNVVGTTYWLVLFEGQWFHIGKFD